MLTPTLDINGRAYNPDLSPYMGHNTQRIEPDQGYFLLPANVYIDVNDRFALEGEWKKTSNPALLVASCLSAPYSRAITDDPILYARMREYARGVEVATKGGKCEEAQPPLVDQLTAARARVSELEAKVKESKITPGCWMVSLVDSPPGYTKGNLYRATHWNTWGSWCTEMDDKGSITNGMHEHYWRRATSEEASSHVAKLARECEIKVGDWVVALQTVSYSVSCTVKSGQLYKVKMVSGYRDALWFDHSTAGTVNYPITAFRKATKPEIEQACRIEVIGEGGKAYAASFENRGVVTFGCARISNRDIRAAHLYLMTPIDREGTLANRQPKSVVIGAGTFSLETLNRLIPQLRD